MPRVTNITEEQKALIRDRFWKGEPMCDLARDYKVSSTTIRTILDLPPHIKVKRGPRPGSPRAVEAGRKGGAAAKAKVDKDFYSRIGKKGGVATRNEYGKEFYQNIGREGGDTAAARHGTEHYVRIGKKGAAVRRERGDYA